MNKPFGDGAGLQMGMIPLTGLAATVWFLIRVIPKPSRATYSRNLDPVNGKGIELVSQLGLLGDFDGDIDVDFEDFDIFATAWRSRAGAANWNSTCDISIPSDGLIDELDRIGICIYSHNIIRC